jgi:hypothetical protein
MKKYIVSYVVIQSGVVCAVHVSTVTAKNEKKAKSLFAMQYVEQEYGHLVFKDSSIRRELAKRVIEKCTVTLSNIQIELHNPTLN